VAAHELLNPYIFFPSSIFFPSIFAFAQTIMQEPQAWLTLVTTFSSIPAALKVSLALVCL
jgi:hypothetical protein